MLVYVNVTDKTCLMICYLQESSQKLILNESVIAYIVFLVKINKNYLIFFQLTGIVTNDFSSIRQSVQIQIVESVEEDTFGIQMIQNRRFKLDDRIFCTIIKKNLIKENIYLNILGERNKLYRTALEYLFTDLHDSISQYNS